ncbi:hypothetical protein [uncultured Mucilaginibacter sp.]|uniref:YncE family protein n=1 Tax=uncultured Mucilaginibacter sp. TaxID=797541 RepID=UPI0025DE1CA0|nr:hypothetical protein [uncultured Mucilaginibacter sp.]
MKTKRKFDQKTFEMILKYTFLIAGLLTVASCKAQTETGKENLTLSKTISLGDIKGRIDHIDINIKDRIAYVAALGNNSLEIVDLKAGRVLHSIKGLDEPQGVAWIATHHEIFVANGGSGECAFYDAVTFKKTASIKLADDADDARYDPGTDRIYVGYAAGGIAIIDASSHKQVGNIDLPSHPESFQIDTKINKIWINLPGSGMIGVADLQQLKLIAKWPRLIPRSNFPMAYDAEQHRLMVGYRLPAKLIIYDAVTSKEIFSAPMVGDADDLYWDQSNKQIYVSGGSGEVNIFKQTAEVKYEQVANIATRGGARTSLLVPELGLFLIAARAGGIEKAALLIYKIN